MKVTAEELCPECRSALWENGMTIEKVLNMARINGPVKDMDDHVFNSAVYGNLYRQIDDLRCMECMKMIRRRLPRSMGGEGLG